MPLKLSHVTAIHYLNNYVKIDHLVTNSLCPWAFTKLSIKQIKKLEFVVTDKEIHDISVFNPFSEYIKLAGIVEWKIDINRLPDVLESLIFRIQTDALIRLIFVQGDTLITKKILKNPIEKIDISSKFSCISILQ
jgi:hypothetical protein